ncbi:MAG: molybdopterin-dependent oxidoreductase [Spirochaetes bacterium]|nr:molybdopterin-dependent oxidoreductase [Spirochaetota bacterium]
MSYKTGVCNFCGTGCGNLIKISDDAIKGVFPSPGHPVGKGKLCVRGWHIHELLNSEDRITSPLIKKNESFEKASYEEAISTVAGRLAKYSGEEIAFLASPRASNEDNYLFGKLARAVFKSNNISLAADTGHRNSVDVLLEGTGMPAMLGTIDDIRSTDFILVVGTDITKLNPILGSEIHMAARAGANVITISSRVTQIAKLSRVHMNNKPGTKKILLAALARIIIEENLQDADYIQKYSEGFEGFANVLGALNLDDVPSVTGIGLDDIKSVARALAKSQRAMAFFSSGISGLDKDTISFIYNLFLVAGKVGKEGCGVNPVAGICNIVGSYDMGVAPDMLPGYQKLQGAAVNTFNAEWKTELSAKAGKSVGELLSAASPKLKALVVVDHDEEIIRNADKIKNIEFVVYLGSYTNTFTDMAHVVIPTPTYAETDGTYTNTERRVQLNIKKFDAKFPVMPAWQIYSKIAEKNGAAWSYKSASDIMTEIAKVVPVYSGITFAKLEKVFGLQWPCDAAHEAGTPRLNVQEAQRKMKFIKVPAEYGVQSATSEYPFLLMTGKANYFWHQNNIMKKTNIPKREYNALLLLYPKGFVDICPEDAKTLGVRDRWPVNIVSAKGSMKIAARITKDVNPGTAYVPYFVQDMITEFLLEHAAAVEGGEDAIIPVKIEKV